VVERVQAVGDHLISSRLFRRQHYAWAEFAWLCRTVRWPDAARSAPSRGPGTRASSRSSGRARRASCHC
jgi:hypothetical protein